MGGTWGLRERDEGGTGAAEPGGGRELERLQVSLPGRAQGPALHAPHQLSPKCSGSLHLGFRRVAPGRENPIGPAPFGQREQRTMAGAVDPALGMGGFRRGGSLGARWSSW